jgi:CubicO group peptidase (beta-lactamase class C family)
LYLRLIFTSIFILKPFLLTHNLKSVALLGLFSLFLVGCTSFGSTDKIKEEELKVEPIVYTPPIKAVETFSEFFERWHTWGGFNGVVYISDSGNKAFEKAYGYSNIRQKLPLDTLSVFQIASVSKPITATAIMILQQQGLINIDASVQTYLPDFPYQGITIKNLLNHTHGLFNYMYFADEAWREKDSLLTMNELYKLILQKQPSVYYYPNKRFSYSNTGYYLLALIVEKITGLAFDEFLAKEIFEPLQMFDAEIFKMGLAEPTEKLVLGHDKFNRFYPPTYLNTVYGDKGVLATAADMAKFADGVMYGSLIPFDTLSTCFAPSVSTGDRGKFYGLGWRVTTRENGQLLTYHTGWWQGFKSLLVIMPESKKSVVILSNSTKATFYKPEDIANLVDAAFATDVYLHDEPL